MRGNIHRILPEGLDANIDLSAVQIPPVFSVIRDAGSVEDAEMLRTFNMGVGMAMVVAKDGVEEVHNYLNKEGHNSFVIGSIAPGAKSVQFKGALQW